jgi:hypothetical protein
VDQSYEIPRLQGKRTTLECLVAVTASLGTPFYQGIFIFPWENELISLGNIEILWENSVSKLALRAFFNPAVV